MTPAVDRRTRRLLQQLAVLEGVLSGDLATVCVKQLQRSIFTEATGLREEMAKPMSEVIEPWTDWNQRNSLPAENCKLGGYDGEAGVHP